MEALNRVELGAKRRVNPASLFDDSVATAVRLSGRLAIR
jgi:hypothetical protein